jgi:magnesium transporter
MKLVQKRSKKTGLSPGTLIHIGEQRGDTVAITLFTYSSAHCDERADIDPQDLRLPADETVTWINVSGVHKVDVLEAIGKQFGLHPCSWKTSRIRISAPSWTIMRPVYSWL